jgi:ABC-2 type transport system ATP-binding protein
MTDAVIETTSLQKIYGSRAVVSDLTLHVSQGEIFGFLGPNGAGKSTSVKMLLGLVRASSGSARVLGQPPGHSATMARVGFLPEHFRFHEWLQATELLDLHGTLYGMDAATRRRRIAEVLELVGLTEHARRPIAGFSKGMLQRIGLAQALLHEPALVFLDEPTSALDPFGRRLVRSIIHKLKERGTTVFLNSHLLGEVEATCDRVSFIKEGRVLRTLGLHDLREEHVIVEVRAANVTPQMLSALHNLTGHPVQTSNGHGPQPASAIPATFELTVKSEDILPAIAEHLLTGGARLYGLTPRRISLEQRFLDIVGTEDSGQ